MVPLEAIGWFFLGAGSMLLTIIGYGAIRAFMIFRSRKKFNAFLQNIRDAAETKVTEEQKTAKGREVSEFSFRDKMGELATVKIVIDHDLENNMPDLDSADIKSMIMSGEAGTLDQLFDGSHVHEQAMSKVQEFVFSPKAVRDMRAAGLEPDEVVTKMLKASWRM